MDDLFFHIALFVASASVIVAVSCMFSEPEDGPALKTFPVRLFKFLVGSGLVLGIMLVLEHTLASVG